VILAPEVLVDELLQEGRLIRVLPNYQGPSRPLNLLFDANRQKTARLRAFIDAATQTFGPNCSLTRHDSKGTKAKPTIPVSQGAAECNLLQLQPPRSASSTWA
jgi:hypothetical protein